MPVPQAGFMAEFEGFGGFAALPALGRVLEIGCGSQTVLGRILDTRAELAAGVTSVTLLDPGISSHGHSLA